MITFLYCAIKNLISLGCMGRKPHYIILILILVNLFYRIYSSFTYQVSAVVPTSLV